MYEYPARPLCTIKKLSPPLDLDILVSNALLAIVNISDHLM